jgi:hypothetical protein
LRQVSRIRPEGRAAGRRAFFDQHRDVLSKNPAKPADPAHRAGRDRRGVLSFGYLFFAQAKKSNSLATASETKAGPEILPLPFTPDCIHISKKTGSLLLICHERHALNLHKPMILREKNVGIPQALATITTRHMSRTMIEATCRSLHP